MFSIIVPVYNIEKYLSKCIESILKQTFGDFELILVDDGSTDGSSIICDKYVSQDKRVKVIHKKNGGLVSARQTGCKIAKGKYIICVDGDDWVSNDYLACLYNIIKIHSPDIICFGYYNVINNHKYEQLFPINPGFYPKEDIIKKIYPILIQTKNMKAFPPNIWGKAFKRELYVIEQLSLNDKIKIGEDAACTIPCISRANNIYIINKGLYYYRHNTASMTKNRKRYNWNGPKLISQHLYKRVSFKNYDFSSQIDRRTVHALFNVVKSQFYQNNNYFDTISDIKNNLKDPIYINAISNANFKKFTIGDIIKKCLKHRLLFLIYIWSKFK